MKLIMNLINEIIETIQLVIAILRSEDIVEDLIDY